MTIAAVLTACSEMYGPEQVSTAVVNSEGIEITGIAVTDNSLTFTLTPKGEESRVRPLQSAIWSLTPLIKSMQWQAALPVSRAPWLWPMPGLLTV